MTEAGCVGFYTVLIDYDEATDSFAVGWNKRVASSMVEEVMIFDLLVELISLSATPLK
jgi:hypothetical protein